MPRPIMPLSHHAAAHHTSRSHHAAIHHASRPHHAGVLLARGLLLRLLLAWLLCHRNTGTLLGIRRYRATCQNERGRRKHQNVLLHFPASSETHPLPFNPARAILILRPQGLRFKSRRSGIRRKRAGAQPHGVAVPCERERGSRSCLISFSHASPVGRCFGRRGGTPSSAAVPRKHSTYSSLISTATRISGSTGLD